MDDGRATHNLAAAFALADRVAVMMEGKLVGHAANKWRCVVLG